MRSLFLMLLAGASAFTAFAQPSYSFITGTSAYSDLSSPRLIPFSTFASQANLFKVTELRGETFLLYNIPFQLDTLRTLHIQPNGNIRFDNDSALIIADGTFAFMDSIDAGSSIGYTIEGSSDHHLLKVQWKNLRLKAGQPDNFVNLQIWLYQASGIIEIHYGARSSNNASGFTTSNGPQVGLFFSRDDFSGCYEKLWINGSPAAYTLDSVANYSFKALSGMPSEGTVYRFVPRFIHTGLADLSPPGTSFSCYPNPAQTHLFLSRTGDYTITDLAGRIRTEAKQTDNIPVADLGAGTYILKDKDGRSRYFIKQ